ncbi:MAG: LCP family protein [Acidobacteriaceae bacterium]
MRSFDINYQPRYQSQQQPPAERPSAPRRKRRWKLKLILLILALGLVYAGFNGAQILSKTNKIFTGKGNIFVRVSKMIFGKTQPLQGEETGTVNILLLGYGGPGHDGAYLTDTMIVASINMETKEVVLISIPRDFVISFPNRGFQKINAAYAYAEASQPGTGGPAAIAAAEKVTGLTIPYYASVDFKGFVKAVDHVGGVDITVDRTFTDNMYPNSKNGYLPPVTFTKGIEHMNGERALIFARSRHGNNGEGNDFARSERQKKILVAMKTKLQNLGLTDISTINELLNDFTENFRTNLEPTELKRLSEVAHDIPADNIYSLSLDPDEKLICQGMIEDYTVKAYVIQPCEGKTLADIHAYLVNATTIAKLSKEGATIEVQNTTGKTKNIDAIKNLSNLGAKVKYATYKGKSSYDRTILYDNSQGRKPKTLQYLKDLNLSVSDVPFYDAQPGSDFVILIGNDM